MSLRCEFLDEERTELCGHGQTGFSTESTDEGCPLFEDATLIGTFDKGYIDEIEDENGEKATVCIGEGTIDASCYHNFVTKTEEDLANGLYPSASVEIMRTPENEGIVYLGGYTEEGRVPTEFVFSGLALIGVKPADPKSKLIELNQKEEIHEMNEAEMKALIAQVVSEMNAQADEKQKLSEECAAQVAEANTRVEEVIAEKNELEASSRQIQAALDQIHGEYEELNKKYDALWEERNVLEKALAEAKAKERIGELNAAISAFSAEEREYAKAEIDAFNENPRECEINSVVSKIYEGIGMAAKKAAPVVNEVNEVVNIEDIFGEVGGSAAVVEDTNIF